MRQDAWSSPREPFTFGEAAQGLGQTVITQTAFEADYCTLATAQQGTEGWIIPYPFLSSSSAQDVLSRLGRPPGWLCLRSIILQEEQRALGSFGLANV